MGLENWMKTVKKRINSQLQDKQALRMRRTTRKLMSPARCHTSKWLEEEHCRVLVLRFDTTILFFKHVVYLSLEIMHEIGSNKKNFNLTKKADTLRLNLLQKEDVFLFHFLYMR